MKRRLIIAGVIAALFIAAIWLVFAWQAHRSRFDYSGTVETREIQIGSKIGGRVTAGSGRRGPDRQGRIDTRPFRMR